MTQSLYEKYRPEVLADVVGQSAVVKVLEKWVADDTVPHAILLSGPSGVGKTTLAYILGEAIGCRKDIELSDINCAVCEPLETVRRIDDYVIKNRGGPITSKRVAWLLDEVQSLSRAGTSQQALLKLLERTPDWAYFFLCTTEPAKVLPTVRGRCQQLALKPLTGPDVKKTVGRVAAAEKINLLNDVLGRIVELADGSAREALVMLEKVAGMKADDAILALGEGTEAAAVVDLCRALMNPKAGWKEVAKKLQDVEGEEPEGVRRRILAWARKALLGGSGRAFGVIRVMQYDVYASGNAGLAANCYEIVTGGGK